MEYKKSLFDENLPKKYDILSKKIITYLRNYDFGTLDVWLEDRERRALGLTPVIYNGISGYGNDKNNWFGYSADPLRDRMKTMASRILLW